MATSAQHRPSKRLAVFCDGTWVGRETTVEGAPPSNIRQLADGVGEVNYSEEPGESPAKVHPIRVHRRGASNATNGYSNHFSSRFGRHDDSGDIVAGYQEGVGLNRPFVDYIWDGATASAIGDECVAVYRFIVDNFTDDHEIWLFGFSRGAFTVRSVAGMINNCGVIKRLPHYTDEMLERLCFDVFRTYRSDLPQDHPHSKDSELFKGDAEKVWQVKRPIRHMGLIDTVGALGIPRLNAGIGFDWAQLDFFDNQVSSAVQYVYHAPALHDRLWIFQPCLVFPGEGPNRPVVRQKWFPGMHYDVGRMTFRLIRTSPSNWIEGALGWLPDLLSRTIYPNEVLSDCVLRWQLEGIRDVDQNSPNPLIPDVDQRISYLDARIASPDTPTGSGDIYGDVLNYAPGGVILGSVQRVNKFFTSQLNKVIPRLGDNIQDLLGIKTLIGILTATSDRRIPGATADVFDYTGSMSVNVNGQQRSVVVAQQAKMVGTNEWGKERYMSKTFEAFLLWKKVFGRD